MVLCIFTGIPTTATKTATTAEGEFKKTVHRNDILHAKQQLRDIAFDDDNLGNGSRNAGENAVGNDAPLDIEANSSDEDDVVDTMQAERWPRCCTTRESVTSR